MQNGEKLEALECIIYEFAKGQFANNDVSPMEAHIIMKNVLSEFQGICLETFILDRVQMAPPDQTQQNPAQTSKAVRETHTGTVDDLKEAMSKTGFKPNNQK